MDVAAVNSLSSGKDQVRIVEAHESTRKRLGKNAI